MWVVTGVVLVVVGCSCWLASGIVGVGEADGSPSPAWSRPWWRSLGLQVAGQASFAGGLNFLVQELGWLKGFAVGAAALGAVAAACFAVVLMRRQRRRRAARS